MPAVCLPHGVHPARSVPTQIMTAALRRELSALRYTSAMPSRPRPA